jgi:exosortase
MKLQRRDLLLLLGTVVLVLLKWQDVRSLIEYASDLDLKNASQVFMIPFVSAGIIYLNRGEIFRNVRYSMLPGALVMVAGFILPAAVRMTGTPLKAGDNLSVATASIVAVWVGAFLFFYGSSAFKAALFPLLFLAFCIPIPSLIMNPLVEFLQRGSAEIAYVLIKLPGTLVYRETFRDAKGILNIVFNMSGLPYPINVAPECSGIRSFISMLILSLVAGHLLLKTTWKRIALVLIAIPIMIFKNGVRIATLTLLSIHVNPDIIQSRLHREGGIPFFILALVLIYPFLTMLMRSEQKETAGEPVTARG